MQIRHERMYGDQRAVAGKRSPALTKLSSCPRAIEAFHAMCGLWSIRVRNPALADRRRWHSSDVQTFGLTWRPSSSSTGANAAWTASSINSFVRSEPRIVNRSIPPCASCQPSTGASSTDVDAATGVGNGAATG